MVTGASMRTTRRTLNASLVAIGVVVALGVAGAVDVTIDVDRTFDFGAARSWGWNPDGRGAVRMARTQEDDPEAARSKAEPIIVATVASEMERRGWPPAAATPDLVITYFLLLSTNVSGQTVGQFVPATPEWGLPPFTRGTQSLKVMNSGSLVLDVSAAGAVVWRGVAHAQIRLDADAARREALLRDAVRDLLRGFPRRS
jgi:hypothetical protein